MEKYKKHGLLPIHRNQGILGPSYLQSRAKGVETLCLLRGFFGLGHLFSFTPPPHFNVVAATKSIGQSNILNTEKGGGGINRMQCNFVENEGKSKDYS